jgi:hypothetical protein
VSNEALSIIISFLLCKTNYIFLSFSHSLTSSLCGRTVDQFFHSYRQQPSDQSIELFLAVQKNCRVNAAAAAVVAAKRFLFLSHRFQERDDVKKSQVLMVRS